MKRLIFVKRLFVALLAVLVVAGCASTNTVESRKQEHFAAYQALPPDLKVFVDQGRLATGMNMDAVYIAWGKPDDVISGGSPAGETVAWIYKHNFLQETQYIGYRHIYYGYTPGSYVHAQVEFVNGLVSRWQTFPSPVY